MVRGWNRAQLADAMQSPYEWGVWGEERTVMTKQATGRPHCTNISQQRQATQVTTAPSATLLIPSNLPDELWERVFSPCGTLCIEGLKITCQCI